MVNMLTDTVAAGSWLLLPALVATCIVFVYLQTQHYKLSHIPTVGGPSWPILSYQGAARFFRHAKEILQEGYEKHYGKIFKVSILDRWLVVVTGPKLMRELLQLPDSVMSFDVIIDELFAGEYTFGKEVTEDPFHVELIKHNLTKNLNAIFPAVYDEIQASFKDNVPPSDDWMSVPALETSLKCIARISNRVFVGLPICRNSEYLDICISFTRKLNYTRMIIGWFPRVLKPVIAARLTPLPASIARASELLKPELVRRTMLMQDKDAELPEDMLTWMMEAAKGDPVRSATRAMVVRILALNFAAIHTSSTTFTHALYTLAANPEHIQPLREEVETVIEAEGGLSKAAMVKMHKLDSFLRESTRVNTFNGLSLMRKALQAHTFSDGTYVPAGTMIASPTWPQHLDEDSYASADTLDPFRFKPTMPEDADADAKGPRRQFTTTDLSYIPFGHGRHACPGRFFAGAELKAMFVHVLLTYDVRTVEPGVRPKDLAMAQSALPNPTARVLFRKRQQ